MLFGGLVNIPMYAYYWVYSAAQLELLACDVPIVVYDKVDDGKEKKHTRKEMEALTKAWMERKQKEAEEGKKEFNFSDYVNTSASNFANN